MDEIKDAGQAEFPAVNFLRCITMSSGISHILILETSRGARMNYRSWGSQPINSYMYGLFSNKVDLFVKLG